VTKYGISHIQQVDGEMSNYHSRDLHPGDSVTFELAPDKKVFVRKATPIDLEFTRALEGTLASEWLSGNDEEAYRDL
jgi:hypothetical protein